jgi:hypothetical protein
MKLKLRQAVNRTSPARQNDVINVKSALNLLGYYEIEDDDTIGYTNNQLFDSMKLFQTDHSLPIRDGIEPDDFMQKSINKKLSKIKDDVVEKEVLPEIPTYIPGTKIPDRGVPEQGYPNSSRYNPYDRSSEINENMDILIERKPLVTTEPRMPVYDTEEKYFDRRVHGRKKYTDL